jgi:hypothetical protein
MGSEMPGRQMKAGDLVELRPPREVLATLDDTGATDGLPFMPEMLEFFGKTFRVQARVERACDTLDWGVRRIPATVMLDDLRCSGQAHAGCQAGCRLYWKEAWLRPASESTTPVARDDAYSQLAKLVGRNTETSATTIEEPIFRCQVTHWYGASQRVPWWSFRSFLREWTCGNVSFWRFSTIMTRIVLSEIGRRLHFLPRGGEPFMPHTSSLDPVETPPPRGLEPGTLVQVRSKREIAPTLDAKGKNRGLWFAPEMLPFCGRTFPVKRKVERFIDEGTGKLVQLKSDCYILDGAVCAGDRTESKWFCPRAIYPWWRESWLRPLAEEGSTADARPEPADRPPPRPQL